MIGTEPHVVRLNDLVRMDEPVLGRQDISAVTGQIGVR